MLIVFDDCVGLIHTNRYEQRLIDLFYNRRNFDSNLTISFFITT